MPMWIGSHVSIAKGFSAAVKTSIAMGANTFQFFTRNPRGGNAKAIDPEDVARGKALMEEHDFGPLVAHAPYTYNLCSNRPEVVEFSKMGLSEDLFRAREMLTDRVVLHPGSHGGKGAAEGIRMISANLLEILPQAETAGVTILLEGMAGSGSEVGGSFDELAGIIELAGGHKNLGVCIDSCHMTGAGYDLKNWKSVLKAIDQSFGWQRVGAFHLNDTKFGLGSHKDRHARLGEGVLGYEGILDMLENIKGQKLPVILETPNDDAGYAAEIRWVRETV